MFSILKAYGIPNELVQAIKLLYKNTRAKFQSGDTLATYFFTIILDYVMREATSKTRHLGFTLTSRRSKRHPPIKISDLDFADDIALTLDTLQEAQNLLSGVEATKVGLHLNAAKTEMIIYNQQDIVGVSSLNGDPIKHVNDFKYLGSWIYSTT
ncbi:uncharacterized protein [Clytia hemisphaerica]|uniref:uncharacterized protein n=1 Tax=Clytia hemisphaerica TaxID=252671 RepID=UPI0034D3B3CF